MTFSRIKLSAVATILMLILGNIALILYSGEVEGQSSFLSSVPIVYIYDTDTTAAQDFEILIESWGWNVDLIYVNNIAAGNWFSYELIILGHDTGSSYNWDNQAQVAFIDGLGTPIIGIGRGGSCFYDDIGLNGSYGMGAFSSGTMLSVNASDHQVFNSPYSFGSSIPLFTAVQSWMGLFTPRLNDSVEVLAVDSVSTNYAMLTLENDRYFYWAYYGDLTNWGIHASHLLKNVLIFLLSDEIIPSTSALAYIYDTDTTAAQDFEILIESWGWSVDLIYVNNIAAGNWFSYELIILGHDTGSSYNWDNQAQVAFIDGLGTPIIGIGRGGSCFYDDIGLNGSYGMGAFSSGTMLSVNASDHQVFNSPYSFGSSILLFTAVQSWMGLYTPRLNDSVEVLAVDSINANYAMLTLENDRYFYWAYYGDLSNWNIHASHLLKNVLVFLLSDGIIPSTSAIAYIYDSDTTTALDFEILIESWGWNVDLIYVNNIAAGNWFSYELIILGHDTGYSYNWDNQAQVAFIDGLGTPIIGIGAGGSCFYDDIGLNGSYGMGMFASGAAMNVREPSHPVFTVPHSFDSSIDVFDTTQSWMGLYTPKLNDSVEVLAVDSIKTNYSLLSLENDRYFYWAYYGDLTSWGTHASHLFKNVLIFLLSDDIIPSTSAIAYIYDSDTTTALDFEILIESWGWSVDLIYVNNIAAGNWFSYELIILGHDTGSSYNWDNQAQVAFIDGLGTPIIGIGAGGSCFYDDLGLNGSYGMGMFASGAAMNLREPSHPVFTVPHNFDSSNDVFDTTQSWMGLFTPKLNDSVEVLAVDSIKTNYSLLSLENDRYFYWAYYGGLTNWGTHASHLFKNVLVFLLPKVHTLDIPTISFPNGGETLQGTVEIQWDSAIDSKNHAVEYRLYYTRDDGENWIWLANTMTNSYLWDTNFVDNGLQYRIKAIASCSGYLTTEDVSNGLFSVDNALATTTSPTTATTATTTNKATSEAESSTSLGALTILVVFCFLVVFNRRRKTR